jgi:putative ABC transport system permease protein
MWRLAARLLFHDRLKFVVAAAGVSVSVLLILTQLGVYFGFLSTASMLFDHSSADLWVTRDGTRGFDDSEMLDDRTYYKVAGTPGVARAERVAFNFAQIRLKQGGRQAVQVVGLESRGILLRPWNIVAGTPNLNATTNAAVVDRSELKKLNLEGLNEETEIEGKKVRIVGLSDGIRTFTTAPIVFTEMRRAQKYLNWSQYQFTFVMVKAQPGTDLEDLRRRLSALPQVSVYGVGPIVDKAQAYWAQLTGVGVSFFSMAVMAIIVGFVVVGQILYNGTIQNLREYATLKAMGARNGSILGLIFAQASITALVGLSLGGLLAAAAYGALVSANLVVVFSAELLIGTLIATEAMCLTAALIPALRLLRLEPTTILKG